MFGIFSPSDSEKEEILRGLLTTYDVFASGKPDIIRAYLRATTGPDSQFTTTEELDEASDDVLKNDIANVFILALREKNIGNTEQFEAWLRAPTTRYKRSGTSDVTVEDRKLPLVITAFRTGSGKWH